MKRIIIHHTAGTYHPNNVDKEHYHYLIDVTGKVFDGKYKPEDNENCNDGKYAAHTFKGNTGSIGIAACCNYGFDLKKKQSLYPFNKWQFEKICGLSAELCIKYHIKPENIFTHYGFDLAHNIKQGKIDITYLPWKPELNPIQVQDYFRQKIKWYITKCKC